MSERSVPLLHGTFSRSLLKGCNSFFLDPTQKSLNPKSRFGLPCALGHWFHVRLGIRSILVVGLSSHVWLLQTVYILGVSGE